MVLHENGGAREWLAVALSGTLLLPYQARLSLRLIF